MTVGAAPRKKPVVVSLSIADAMAGKVITEQRNEYEVDLIGLDAVIVNRLADLPTVVPELGVGTIQKAFDVAGFVVDSRSYGNNVGMIAPNSLKNRPGIYFAESLYRNEAMQYFNGGKVEILKKFIDDMCARTLSLLNRHQLASSEVIMSQFGLVHGMISVSRG